MEGCRLVALGPGQSRQGGHVLLHIQLIGHGMGRLEKTGEAREILKFHRSRSAAGYRGVHPALDGVLLQGVKERCGILRNFKAVKNGEVRKGLIHNDHQVGRTGHTLVGLHPRVLLHQLQYRLL